MNLTKLLSGRLISVVVIMFTYSATILMLTYSFCKGVVNSETYVSILNGFVGIASVIVYAYFNKKSADDIQITRGTTGTTTKSTEEII
jgi:hypothetical protein